MLIQTYLLFWNAFKHNIQYLTIFQSFFLKRVIYLSDFWTYVHDLSCTAEMKESHISFLYLMYLVPAITISG